MGLYDITPAKFGLNDNFVVLARDEFGKRSETYNGVDFNLDVRLPRGLLVPGGTSTGRTALDTCSVVDSPQELRFCDTTPPFQTRRLLNVGLQVTF